MSAWVEHNLHSLRVAFKRLIDAPLASLFTVLVIAVALSLPAGLYLALANLQRLAGNVPTEAELSLFLKTEVGLEQARRLAAKLATRPEVRHVRLIDRDAALAQLAAAGLGEVAAALPANPLPHTLVVSARDPDPTSLERLREALARLPEVERVNLDTDWARRLAALLALGRDLVTLLAILLGLALAVITGNTIRLQIYAQRDEIEVARLIGATDRFIRRPFLYFGALQGLAGGLAAWLLLAVTALLLEDSVARLADSYGTTFRLTGLAAPEAAALLATSTLLGLAGAYFAVGYTLRGLDTPR